MGRGPSLTVGCGIVFKLAPSQNGQWTYTIVYALPGGTMGEFPTDDRPFVDANGNIFATTFTGGDVNQNSVCPQEVLGLGGCGVVMQITP
jgi:hypothetical protein